LFPFFILLLLLDNEFGSFYARLYCPVDPASPAIGPVSAGKEDVAMRLLQDV
jgi:hypothetical protein